jgi:hypothetical protein
LVAGHGPRIGIHHDEVVAWLALGDASAASWLALGGALAASWLA